MSRLLFLVVVVALVYWLFQSYRKRPPQDEKTSAPAEDMVRCAQCGVHLPKRESILADGRYYCSEAHRLAHNARSD